MLTEALDSPNIISFNLIIFLPLPAVITGPSPEATEQFTIFGLRSISNI